VHGVASLPKHRCAAQEVPLFWRELADLAQKVIALLLGTYSKLATLLTYPLWATGNSVLRFVSAAAAHGLE